MLIFFELKNWIGDLRFVRLGEIDKSTNEKHEAIDFVCIAMETQSKKQLRGKSIMRERKSVASSGSSAAASSGSSGVLPGLRAKSMAMPKVLFPEGPRCRNPFCTNETALQRKPFCSQECKTKVDKMSFRGLSPSASHLVQLNIKLSVGLSANYHGRV